MTATDLDALCDAAEQFHAETLGRLDALDARVHGSDQGARLVAPWSHFTRGLREHFAEEEEILFPALRLVQEGHEPHGDHWRSLMADMDRELDQVRTIADALRSAARDAPALEAELLELLDGLETHAELEERVLLPAARAALGEGGADPGWQAPDPAQPTRGAPAPAPAPAAAPAPEPGGVLRRTARRLRRLLRT